MSDVKDIMGLPRQGQGQQDKQKPKEQKVERPRGMSREAFALLGNNLEVNLKSTQLLDLKRRAQDPKEHKSGIKLKISYQWRPIDNPARTDGFQVHHWVKCFKDDNGRIREEKQGQYQFAKYGKKFPIVRYNEEEYLAVVAPESDDWSREETDYLLDLCEMYSLRWFIIHDRYKFPAGKQRSIEQLKQRYYSMARLLLRSRGGKREDAGAHPVMRKTQEYNPRQDRARKEALRRMYLMTEEQEKKEEELLRKAEEVNAAMMARNADEARRREVPSQIEVKKSLEEEQRRKVEADRSVGQAGSAAHVQNEVAQLRDRLLQRSSQRPPVYSNTVAPGETSLMDFKLKWPQLAPGVYARGHYARDELKMLYSSLHLHVANSSRQKAFQAELQELGISLYSVPLVQTRRVCHTFQDLRTCVAMYVYLAKVGAAKAASAAGDAKRPNKKKRLN